jgi:thiol-disulfide isomerase/thioredoxin
MNKFTILLTSLILAGQFMFAQVARDKVVIEVFTGPNCPFCPAAANGIQDLKDAGYDIAAVAYHTTAFSIPQFYTPETNARAGYYSFSGYPTAFFDGVLNYVGGGGAGQTTFPQYLNLYNQRIGAPSQFEISLSYENVGGNDYEATVVIEKVVATTYNNIVLQLILTESHIQYPWQGMSELNSVTRDMIPTQNGTPLDFSGGDVIELTLPFTMNPAWEKENCELIAFVQNNSGKEIMQGKLVTMNTPEHNLDAELFEVMNIPDEICSGLLEPEVVIRNKGAEVLTSLNINFEVNGNLVYTHAWEGSLNFTDKEHVVIPEFSFMLESFNEIDVYISDPNNGTDENPDNDHQSFEAEYPELVENYLLLIMSTDSNPQETSWEVFDGNGDVIGSGGPYTIPNNFFRDTVYYTGAVGCHRFVMYDAGGNGLSTYYTLRSFVDGTMKTIGNGAAFGYKEVTEFSVDSGVGIDDLAKVEESIEVFPNPVVNSSTIRFNLHQSSDVTVELYNSAGKLVRELANGYLQAGANDVTLSASGLTNGVYFIKINAGDQTITRKIAVVK